jgi:hypothetical protein
VAGHILKLELQKRARLIPLISSRSRDPSEASVRSLPGGEGPGMARSRSWSRTRYSRSRPAHRRADYARNNAQQGPLLPPPLDPQRSPILQPVKSLVQSRLVFTPPMRPSFPRPPSLRYRSRTWLLSTRGWTHSAAAPIFVLASSESPPRGRALLGVPASIAQGQRAFKLNQTRLGHGSHPKESHGFASH